MWRLADGFWKSGRQGEEQQETAFLGYFRACRIHDDTTEDDDQYQNLEVDLELGDGRVVTCKTTLMSATSGKPTYLSSIAMAHFITQSAKDQLVQLVAKAGGAMTRYEGRTITFLNTYHVDEDTLAIKEIRAPKPDGSKAWFEATLRPLLTEVAKHPAYASRPTRAERKAMKDAANDPYADETTPAAAPARQAAAAAAASTAVVHATLKELIEEIQDGGVWPMVLGADAGYVAIANKLLAATGGNGEYKTMAEVPEGILGMILEGYRKNRAENAKVPELLLPYVKVAGDPFA
jgi:hypothetical protein